MKTILVSNLYFIIFLLFIQTGGSSTPLLKRVADDQ